MPSPRRAPARVQEVRSAPNGRAILGALIATLALQILGWRLTTNWLWGTSALHAWPAPGAAALVALALLGFVPAFARGVSAGLGALGQAWERAGTAGDLVAAAVFGLLLFCMRDPLRYVGDSYIRLGVLALGTMPARPLEHVFPLDRLINLTLPRALAESGIDTASGLQLMGALVGSAFALAVFRFLRAAGARAAALPAGALVVLGGALSTHFAGYDKFGPLMLGLAIAGLGVFELSHRGRGFGRLGIGAAIAVLSHRSGFLALPTVLWAGAHAWRRAERPARARALLAGAALLAAVAAMLPPSLDTLLHFDRTVHLPGGAVAGARVGGGWPAAWLAVADAANALVFLVPLCLVAVSAAAVRIAEPPDPREHDPARSPLAWTAALAIAPFFALLLLVHPAGGWARDWDVGTGAGVVAALASGAILVRSWRSPGAARTLAPAATLALAVAASLWGVHASETIGSARLEELVRARPPLSDATRAATLDFIGARALNAGQAERAAGLFEQAIAVGGPNPRLVYQAGLAHLTAGDVRGARDAFVRAAALNRAVADPWLGLSRIALAERDTARAAAMLDSAVARNPADRTSRNLARELRRRSSAPGPTGP